MIKHSSSGITRQVVSIEDILPALGLAYVSDGARSWAISRCTAGPGLDGLYPGQRLRVALRTLDDMTSLVEHYEPDLV